MKVKTEGDSNYVIRELENYFTKHSIQVKGLNKEQIEDRIKNNEVIEVMMTYDAKLLKKNRIILDISSMDKVKGVFEN